MTTTRSTAGTSARNSTSARVAPARTVLLAALAGSVFSAMTAGTALGQNTLITGPVDPRVVSGQAAFSRQGNNFTITTSRLAIINYTSFNVGSQDTVRFIQPDAQSRVLNRITGMMPTTIEGRIDANGRVYWINPAGVTFGQGAVVNVGQFFAAAGQMADRDFITGLDRVTNMNGVVNNKGTINAGSVTLAGGVVSNSGTVRGLEGSVVFASGNEVIVQQRGTDSSNGLTVRVAGDGNRTASAGVTNTGTVTAARRVAFASGDVASLAISNAGTVRSQSISMSAPRGNVLVGGSVDASSTTARGGNVSISGDRVALVNADVNASGATGGGQVNIGGNLRGSAGPVQNAQSVYVSPGSNINASATQSGNGGQVVVWSEQATNFQGSAQASGAGERGSGGLIETSSRGQLTVGNVLVSTAASGSGQAGLWLLDPSDINIVNNAGDPAIPGNVFDPVGASGSVSDSAILASLATGNVTISTAGGTGGTGNITVDGAVNIAYTGVNDRTLTLDADGAIDIQTGAVISSSNGRLGLTLDAGGAITVAGSISTNGGQFAAFGPGTSFTLTNAGSVSTARAGAQEGGLISIRPTGTVTINGALATNGDIDAGERSTAASNNLPAIVELSGSTLTISNTGSIIASSTDFGGNVVADFSGNIDINGPLTTATIGTVGSAVHLRSGGSISQSGTGLITAGSLSASAATGISLGLANVLASNTDAVATPGVVALASPAGNATLQTAGAVAVSTGVARSFTLGAATTLPSLTGIAVPGNTEIQSGGAIEIRSAINTAELRLTSTGGVTQSGTGTITAQIVGIINNDDASATTGDITLNLAGNDVDVIAINQLDTAATNRSVTFTDSDGLEIGRVSGTATFNGNANLDGISASGSGDSLRINTGQQLVITRQVSSNAITINSAAGAINNGPAGQLVSLGDGLLVLGTGTFNFLNASSGANQVVTIAANITGSLLYRTNLDGTSIGAVNGTNGVNVGTGASNTVTFDGGGVVTFQQTQPITAGGLLLTSGNYDFGSVANSVGTLAAQINTPGTGVVRFRNASALSIGTVNNGVNPATNGLVVGNTPDGTVGNGGLVELTLDAGNLTQTAAGNIITDTLRITSQNQVALLTSTTNDVDAIEGLVTGASSRFRWRDANSVQVGAAGGLAGIQTNDSDIDIIAVSNTGGTPAISITEAIDTDGTPGGTRGSVSLTANGSNGGIAQSGSGVITANRLLLTGTGALTLDTLNNGVIILNAAALSGGSTTSVRLRSDTDLTTVEAIGNLVGQDRVGLLAIQSDSIVSQAVGTTTDVQNLALRGAGGFTLRVGPVFNTNPNSNTNLAASLNGPTSYLDITNVGNLVVGTADGLNGINVGALVTNIVRLNNVTGAQVATPTITQGGAANQAISSGGLILAGNGTITLNNTQNAFSVLAGSMAQTAGVSTFIAHNGALTIGTVANDAALPVGKQVTATGFAGNDLTIVNTGAISITEAIDLGAAAGTLRLQSTAGVAQSANGTITANGLGVVADGVIDLALANDVNTVALTNAAGNNAVTFNGDNGYTIGTIALQTGWNSGNALVGITAARGTGAVGNGATVTLSGNGSITQSADAAGVATGNIDADSLVVTGAGPVTLNVSAFNDVDAIEGALTGAGNAFAYTDRNNLQVGGIGATTGISTNNGNISLTTGVFDTPRTNAPLVSGALTLTEVVNAGTGTVAIDSTNGVTQSGTGTITADALVLTGQGAFDLDNLNSDVNSLAMLATGAAAGLTFQDTDGFAVTTVGTTNGINVGTAAANTVSLNTGGGTLTQDQPIIANGLALRGTTPSIVLTSTTNSFTNLAVSTTGGATTVRNSNATTVIGRVTAIDTTITDGIDTTANTGSVTLMTGGTVTQSATAAQSRIRTNELALIGNGTFTLTNNTNDVNRLAAGASNAADLPAPDRFTSGPAGLTFVNADGFAVDAIDPAGADVGLVSGITATGPVALSTNNTDAITLRQSVVTTAGGTIIRDNVLLDAPGPGRSVTIDGGSGIVRVYGTINGAAGQANLQSLVVRSAATPSVDLPPIGFGGSIGGNTALRTLDVGANLANTPASSTVVFASNWNQTAGNPNENRLAQNPGTGPFVINAQDSIRLGDRHKLLSFGNLTLNARGANNTVNTNDAGLDRGVARFGDVSVVGNFTVNADDIRIGLRPIEGAGSPRRPFGRNFTDAPVNNPANRQQLAENGTGEDGIFHPASDTNGADVVANAIVLGVEPTFIVGGTQVTRAGARATGVQTISIFSVSDPANTGIPGFNGGFDVRRRSGPRATLTVADHFFPSTGATPTSTPALDLIATGDLGALESRSPVLPPNLPEVDSTFRLTRVNRDFLTRLQVPFNGETDPSAAIDRLVGRSLFNDATGASLVPAADEPSFMSTLRERHNVSIGRLNNDATDRARAAGTRLFGESGDINAGLAQARNTLAEAHGRFLSSTPGGSVAQFSDFVAAGEPEAAGVLSDLRTFFGDLGLLGMTASESAAPASSLIDKVRPESMSPAAFRELLGGPKADAPARMTPVQTKKAVVAIEQRFNELFLVQVPMLDENAKPLDGAGTYPRFNAIKATLGQALNGFAEASGGKGDSAAFTDYCSKSQPQAAQHLSEIRSFFSELDGLGMSPSAREDSRSKTLEMLRPSNIAPDLFRQLVTGSSM